MKSAKSCKLMPNWQIAMQLATPGGLEPPASRLEGGCSIQLSYGATLSTFKRSVAVGQGGNGCRGAVWRFQAANWRWSTERGAVPTGVVAEVGAKT